MGMQIIAANAYVAVEIRRERYADIFLERHHLHVGRKIYPVETFLVGGGADELAAVENCLLHNRLVIVAVASRQFHIDIPAAPACRYGIAVERNAFQLRIPAACLVDIHLLLNVAQVRQRRGIS